MENKKEKFVYHNWHWFLFWIFILICLSYLILQRGVWSFTDSGFYYQTASQAQKIAFSKLGEFTNTDGFYFGFDSSATSFSHLLINFYQLILTSVFGSDLGQIVYYLVYYFLCFNFGLKLLEKLFPDFSQPAIRIGALFLAFNPFSLLIVTLFTIGYIYAGFIVFLYSFINYLEKGRIKDLLFSGFFATYLFSYLRLIPIIGLSFLFIIWLFHARINFNLKRIIIFGVILFLLASPFIVVNLLSLIGSNNIVTNYQEAYSKYDVANYNFKQSFVNSFVHPGGFTPSALSFYYNNRGLAGFSDNFAVNDSFEFYKFVQLLFNATLLIISLWLVRDKRVLKIIMVILIVLFINTLGNFLPLNLFAEVNKTVLIFLYNDYGFLQFIESIFLAFLTALLINQFQKKSWAGIKVLVVSSFIIFYLAINFLPFLSGHYGFKKVNNIPASYKQILFNNEDLAWPEATIFIPYHWLKFEWAPYYLDLNNFSYSKYKSLITPNLRVINYDLAKFYNQIYDNFDQAGLRNIFIFNIKNFFVFHDVADANKNIDTYEVKDIQNNSAKINSQIIKRSDLKLVKDYGNFSFYRFQDADLYDFFIYSPKNIYNLNFDNFYNKALNPQDKPLIFNKSELNRVNLIDESAFYTNSPKVLIKAALDNPNKYYVKLENVDKTKPFLIQLNQMYSTSWRVYFTNESRWENILCETSWENFKYSDSARCLYSGLSVDSRDLWFVFSDYLNPENHFRGNLIGNTFLFTPADIPAQYQRGSDLYLVIYFQKQFDYFFTLITSISTFLLLLSISFTQWARIRKKYVR
jgi:hypothetical protein